MIATNVRFALAIVVALSSAHPPVTAQQAPAISPEDLTEYDVYERGIPDLQESMRAGEIRSRELVEIYLARIAAYDRNGPRLNAMVSLNPRALEQAEALDRERARGKVRGPLHGIPVVVKDNYETLAMPTSAGSIALGSFQTATEAHQVQRLREAGAVIIGKTNMHELASGITNISSTAGWTRNPYDLRRNPGGSSGGTAVAVAASFAAAGMGSDTCGSIRIPASHNALVGLRGTQGLASSRGIVPLSHTQDIGGPIARTLTDLTIMLDATVGYDPKDPPTARSQGRIPRSYRDALQKGGLDGARIGVLESMFGSSTEDNEVGDVVLKTLNEMQVKHGAQLIDVAVPGIDEMLRGSGVITHEFKFDLADYLASHPNAPVKSLEEILSRGLYTDWMERALTTRSEVKERNSDAYRRALARRDDLRKAVLEAMDQHRVVALAYPTIRRKPALLGEPQPGTNCSLSANSGLPALSVNAGVTDDGLPVGVEFLGREWSESDLLKLAYDWEQRKQDRLAPSVALPLRHGKAPEPRTWEQESEHMRGRFTWNHATSEFTYDIAVKGVRAEDLRLVALQRGDDESATNSRTHRGIILRLVEAGSLTGSGTAYLPYPFHWELRRGDLFVQVYTRQHPLGLPRLPLVP